MELQISDLENSINNQVRQSMEKRKRIFLAWKIRVIHDELGDKGDPEEEAEELRVKLKALNLSEDVHERIDKEILVIVACLTWCQKQLFCAIT